MKPVCIIPARGGSKRIPGKNIRPFAGRPMVAWSIAAALNSGLFGRVIVSTDSPDVMKVARDAGAEVPFMRPAHLADDRTPTVPVIRHAITAIAGMDKSPELVCCLYATAPLVTVEDLSAGHATLQADPSLEFAFAIARFDFPIFRALRLGTDARVSMYWPENELARSQDLPSAFHDAGQFVWGRREAWMTRERIFSSRSRGIVLPPERVQDIDTEDDWRLAEVKFETISRN